MYDALNRPVSITDPGDNSTEYVYDTGGLLKEVYLTPSGGAQTAYVTDIVYDAKGQRQSVSYGNSTTTTYTYDPYTFRLKRLLTQKGTDTFQDLEYFYDPTGNITRLWDHSQRSLFFNNSIVLPVQDYTYDALYRLSEAHGREQTGTAAFGSADNHNDNPWMGIAHKGDDNSTQNYTQYYTYDAAGNILSLQHQANAGSYTRDYTYITGTNRLEETTVGSSTYTYGHDTRGNMTVMPHLSAMVWNARNQLCQTSNGTVTGYYQYRDGQRMRKVVLKPGGIKEERLYLGNYEVYRKYTGATLDIQRITVHIADDTGRIALFEKRTVGSDPAPVTLHRYIYSNHLGSATLELDHNAAIISYEEYHPYGTTAYQAMNATINAVAKRYRYTGKERDEESGLYYHGARYYAPWLGRWTAGDPLESKYAPQSPYVYCSGNPVSRIDPDGMGDEKVQNPNGYGSPNNPMPLEEVVVKAQSSLNLTNNVPANDNTRVAAPVVSTSFPSNDYERGVAEFMGAHPGLQVPADYKETAISSARTSGPYEQGRQSQLTAQALRNEGYNQDGSPSFLKRLEGSKYWQGFADNIALRMVDLYGVEKLPVDIGEALIGKIGIKSNSVLFSHGMGIEPASKELLEKVSQRRDIIIAAEGSDELKMLDYFKAEASVSGENYNHILLRQNPSKAAVLEEFLHGTQSRLGIIKEGNFNFAEFHVKDFMIRHGKILGLQSADIQMLKIQREQYLQKLSK